MTSEGPIDWLNGPGGAGSCRGPWTDRFARSRLASVLSAVLVSIGALALPPVTTAATPFSVSLSDTPSASDPLLVAFTATVVPGSPTMFNWSFGDGSYWNGSGAAFFSPWHLFASASTYNVSVQVHEGSALGTQWLLVTLPTPILSVRIQSQNTSGSVPLTVSFEATVLGGSGTYRSFSWTFGDGSAGSGLIVSYTYVHPGRFTAVLNVTDSKGVSSLATVQVNATDGGGASRVPGSSPASIALWGGSGAAAGALATALVTSRFLRRSSLASRSAGHRVEAQPSASRAESPPPSPLGYPPAPPAGSSVAATETVIAAPNPPTRPSSPEALRISERVVVHLVRLGTLPQHEVAPLGFSQLGMATDLQIAQNRLTNVLRRLVAGGILTEELRHVRGRPRRLKVYRLTPRGEGLGRELRRRARANWTPVSGPNATRGTNEPARADPP
ncbi:MAG: PKD domain-containing protein [Thermoplasmata archaeon]|nr:PKD domain-containing protein [Thermoplasmata archaeon]